MTQAVEPGATAHQVAVNEGHGRLTANEREALQRAFAEDGYFVVRGVVSREKLTRLHSHLMEEFESAKRSGSLISGGGSLAGHLNCYPGEGARFAYEALEERGIIDLIKSIYTRRFNGPHVGCNRLEQHRGPLPDRFVIVDQIDGSKLLHGRHSIPPGTPCGQSVSAPPGPENGRFGKDQAADRVRPPGGSRRSCVQKRRLGACFAA